MRAILVVAVAVAGCSNVHVNRATLIASTAALACDWAQTRGMASADWTGHMEDNPVLGERPSTTSVDLYFAVATMINLALWHTMPTQAKSAVPVALSAVTAGAIRHSIESGTSVCGF